MLEQKGKFEIILRNYEELEQKMADPSVAANPQIFSECMKEYKNLEPIVVEYRNYLSAQNQLSEAEELLELSEDAELLELAKLEKETALAELERTEESLKILLLPKDPRDEKNIILEIRAGAGGEEAALFAHSLHRMYSMYAESKGWKMEILSANETELGGVKEIVVSVLGDNVYSRLKFESGVHRVQRVPETESGGRIHTSTVTVAIMAEADEVEVDINPTDLKIDVFRSSGAGGQHINKTESAVRITHLPTGLVVECQDERSQYKNKDKAMKVLRSRLLDAAQRNQAEKTADERKSLVGTGDRSERIRTYNFPQGRVTDHRIGLTLYKIDSVMDGDLDEILDALITADRAAKLADSKVGEV